MAEMGNQVNTRNPDIALIRNVAEHIQKLDGAKINAPALSTIFHVHPSVIRTCIGIARKMGIPICSCPKGYFYSTEREKIQRTIDHIERRIAVQRESIEGLRRILTNETV